VAAVAIQAAKNRMFAHHQLANCLLQNLVHSCGRGPALQNNALSSSSRWAAQAALLDLRVQIRGHQVFGATCITAASTSTVSSITSYVVFCFGSLHHQDD